MANCVKKYKILTLEEGVQIFEKPEKNPKDSFETIAKIFSEKLGKKLNRITVYRNHIKIKSEKPNRLKLHEGQKRVNGLYSTAVLKFERKLYA